ncbi:hypothetical protein E2C01_088564 [Portunus trituberculatus]|uniref:Endonuclease/exonuclease/phosphatase domain-containing protein n=1 Tax=Portunus trituberculatus TaxID=210409 RepID=A0A5B7JJQ7_PORTR|nr:hypothetical protein [Portunus trituberculatus]
MDNAGQWSKKVLQLTMVNAMDQFVEESTRYRVGKEETSLLDLVFTKKPEAPPIIQYLSPMGRSDHVTCYLLLGVFVQGSAPLRGSAQQSLPQKQLASCDIRDANS